MKRFSLTIAALLISLTSLFAQQIVWHDPMEGEICYIDCRIDHPEVRKNYHRIAESVKPQLRDAVWSLSKNSAGLTIRFVSNSPTISIRYTLENGTNMHNMAPMGSSGVDLYSLDAQGHERWCAAPSGIVIRRGDESKYTYRDLVYDSNNKEGHLYELYLPLYNTVSSLKIGTPEGYNFRFVEPDKQKPIIVYGTSIAQGASASRPGMAWTAILKREFDRPVINLGFSGNGRLEAPVVDYICQADAAVYILDCIPNMCGMLNTIAPRITEAVEKIRKVSNAPIIITEHCGTLHAEASPKSDEAHVLGNKECRKAYEQLKKQGVKGLFYLSKEDIGLSMDSSIDGWHPNDIGMAEYAEAYTKVIKKALKNSK